MPMSSPYEFPSLDYASHREFGEQLQIERMNDAIRKGHSTVTPFRRTLRNLGLAFLMATGAFWTVMLKDPPKTVAADPGVLAEAFSPLDLRVRWTFPVEITQG